MNGRRGAFLVALLQTAALVAIVALQDPEVRRNVAWALEWGRMRALDFIRGPGLPVASDAEIAKVISRAEAIVAEAVEGEAG